MFRSQCSFHTREQFLIDLIVAQSSRLRRLREAEAQLHRLSADRDHALALARIRRIIAAADCSLHEAAAALERLRAAAAVTQSRELTSLYYVQ